MARPPNVNGRPARYRGSVSESRRRVSSVTIVRGSRNAVGSSAPSVRGSVTPVTVAGRLVAVCQYRPDHLLTLRELQPSPTSMKSYFHKRAFSTSLTSFPPYVNMLSDILFLFQTNSVILCVTIESYKPKGTIFQGRPTNK
jgi:hypothetical protein